MAVQPKLLCDRCHTEVLSAVAFVTAQNPQAVGHICLNCVAEYVRKKNGEEE